MPIHDWTRVDAGLFHAFHQWWICALSDFLNSGGLPPDYFALIEQDIRSPMSDALDWRRRDEINLYADKADHITIRRQHYNGGVVAVLEIVSPGNKTSRERLRAFVNKTAILIHQKVHLLVIDLLPPSSRDRGGIHKAIWDEFEEADFELPPGRPLLLAAYAAGSGPTAYIEPIAVGDVLPDMPLFLEPEIYVPVPLEASYQRAWRAFPAVLKRLLEGPELPPA